MNRSAVLRRGLERSGTSQSELSRLTGVPQGRISRYAAGRLEPSEGNLDHFLSALGMQVSYEVFPVAMERTKLRSWMLHREISRRLSAGMDESDWERMARNLDRLRSGTRGQPHDRNIGRWQRIVGDRDLRGLRRVLLDTSIDGVEMREVSPMSGFLTDGERLQVLQGVLR
jgi:transcriptional regulator with XRE-family HTH domain